LINRTALKKFGYRDPIGKVIRAGNETDYTIIGVIEDYHFESLRSEVFPLVLTFSQTGAATEVRLRPGSATEALASIGKAWSAFAPDVPFTYSFLDEDFNILFQSEQQLGTLFSLFTGLAIFISCLGLFGLAAYTAEQRTKEIGIRKVLGASVGSIVTLLSKDFLRLVTLAFVIAVPVAWYAMHKWLGDFVYRATIDWRVFAAAGVAAVVVALLTVSFQSIKAALANPVKSLRSE
jgi:putative ABC transport system permease protein